jgi:hypothetical protein
LVARAPASAREMPSIDGTLEAVCASLIPAGDGMPSAAATQAPAYVLRRSATDADVARNLSTVVETLDRLALQRFKSPFARLPDAHRILVLRTCERASPDVFSFLVNTVYEGYYTDARVLRLLDARCNPPLAVSAEALLAPVRRKFGAGRPE